MVWLLFLIFFGAMVELTGFYLNLKWHYENFRAFCDEKETLKRVREIYYDEIPHILLTIFIPLINIVMGIAYVNVYFDNFENYVREVQNKYKDIFDKIFEKIMGFKNVRGEN